MNKQTITTQTTTLEPGQLLGHGMFWILKQFIQAGLVLCAGGVTYALIDGTAVQGLAIPGMIVVMLLVGRFIYKPGFGTATVVANSMPGSQMVDSTNDHELSDDRWIDPTLNYEPDNMWHNTFNKDSFTKDI